MEENLYWIIEYGKVFLGYGILMFLWPMVMFRKFLSGKSVTFRFCFCVTGQVVLINTVVLLLGLLHILNEWTMRILFYGSFLYSIRGYLALTKERKTKLKYLVNGSYGWKNFLMVHRRKLIRRIEAGCERLGRFYKKHWLEYSLLIVALVYAMIYFSWGVFHEHSYGFGDMYVHHSWIYGLAEGKIFSAGVYPEAMHCVIYSMHALFDIDIYSCMLFLAGIHIIIILVAAYCFMKELFAWRFSAIIVLVVFLTIDVVCVDGVFSMSRLQWTLPQEYGFHTIYICALYLLKYLSGKECSVIRGKKSVFCWDGNLLLFTLALAASIAIHFYVTIMAFFLCLAVAFVSLKKIFQKKHFLPLLAGVFAGVFIAVAPMGIALASGIQFQGSIGWAVNVINGTDTVEGRTQSAQSYIEKEQNDSMNSEEGQKSGNVADAAVSGLEERVPVVSETEITIIDKVWSKCCEIVHKLWQLIGNKAETIYSKAYVSLYKGERASILVFASCAILTLCALISLILFILARVKKKKRNKNRYAEEYPMVVLATFLFMVLYAAPYLGLPELIAGARLCSNMHLLLIIMLVLPVDMLFSLIAEIMPKPIENMIAVFIVVGFVVGIYAVGCYHGYLYFELTRYNAAVNITVELAENLPQNSYTIVSTTDEQYQVIQDGRHEELLNFFPEEYKSFYMIPTEYVFIFVEKEPIFYAHNHFFSGPDWLAKETYQEFYSEKSVWPEILHSEISKEEAVKKVLRFPGKPSRAYTDRESRPILESKMYEWCEEFKELYPNEMKIYYEDEAFVCYYFRQNMQSLYNLNLE